MAQSRQKEAFALGQLQFFDRKMHDMRTERVVAFESNAASSAANPVDSSYRGLDGYHRGLDSHRRRDPRNVKQRILHIVGAGPLARLRLIFSSELNPAAERALPQPLQNRD